MPWGVSYDETYGRSRTRAYYHAAPRLPSLFGHLVKVSGITENATEGIGRAKKPLMAHRSEAPSNEDLPLISGKAIPRR